MSLFPLQVKLQAKYCSAKAGVSVTRVPLALRRLRLDRPHVRSNEYGLWRTVPM